MLEVVDVDFIPRSVCALHSQCKIDNGWCRRSAKTSRGEILRQATWTSWTFKVSMPGNSQAMASWKSRTWILVEKISNFKTYESEHLEKQRTKLWEVKWEEITSSLWLTQKVHIDVRMQKEAGQCIDKLRDTLGMYKGKYQRQTCKQTWKMSKLICCASKLANFA